jgi:hypothetical protein
VTSYALGGRGSIHGKVFSTVYRPALRPTQPPIQRVPGALSSGVKRQERKANHSPPSSAEVKNGGAIPPLQHTSSWNISAVKYNRYKAMFTLEDFLTVTFSNTKEKSYFVSQYV